MLRLGDLALRPDLQIGPMLVSPSRRLVEGPGGHAHLEPLIMQVFLLLLDAGGKVVTRNELFDQCWGGVMVGDASLNRTIVKIRRTGAQIAPGLFEIETIPRTGYRLTGQILQFLDPCSVVAAKRPAMSRRAWIGAVSATAATFGGVGLWWMNSDRTDPRFGALMERGEEALRLDQPGAANHFERAAAIEPRSAKAWGLLAYSLAKGVYGLEGMTDQAANTAQRAARNAREIDPNESNALLAMTMIQSRMLDRLSIERAYREIRVIDPANARVLRHLGSFFHSVGRCRDALDAVDRALAMEPLVPDHWSRKAMRLWIVGRVADSDRVIDRALQLWRSHHLVRLSRLMIYAFTGRSRAALAIIEEEQKSPTFLTSDAASVWQASLLALETPTASAIATARRANLEGSAASPQVAAVAMVMLSALGELDAAFDVANGFLLDRGTVIVRPRAETKPPRVDNASWRNTFGLFIPPTKAMRLDPRFKLLADGLGLSDYWRRRGIGPDAFLFKA